jgi:type-F conjugative transfer system pilin assembly protein TrbC
MLQFLNRNICLVILLGFAMQSHADTTTEAQRQAELASVDTLMQKKEFKDMLKNQQQQADEQSFDPKGTGFNVPKQYYSGGQFSGKSLLDKNSYTEQIKTEKAAKSDYPMVFVSFSLPKATLIKLMDDMHRVGGAVIFRGLVENDFKKTTEAIRALGTNNANALIDPTLFKRFGIKQVPTFVVPLEPVLTCIKSEEEAANHPCPIPKNFRASGDMSFGYLLDLVERTGDATEKSVAEKLDHTLRGDQ